MNFNNTIFSPGKREILFETIAQGDRLKPLFSSIGRTLIGALLLLFSAGTAGTISSYSIAQCGFGVTKTVESDPIDGYVSCTWGANGKLQVAKVDRDGTVILSAEFLGDGEDQEAADWDMELTLAAQFCDITSFGDGYVVSAEQKLIRLDSELEVVDIMSIDDFTAYKLSPTSDGGILVAGYDSFAKVTSSFRMDRSFGEKGIKVLDSPISFVFESHSGNYIALMGTNYSSSGSLMKTGIFLVSDDGNDVKETPYGTKMGIKNLTHGIKTSDGGYAFTGFARGGKALFLKTNAKGTPETTKLVSMDQVNEVTAGDYGIVERPYGYMLTIRGNVGTAREEFQFVRIDHGGAILQNPLSSNDSKGGNAGS